MNKLKTLKQLLYRPNKAFQQISRWPKDFFGIGIVIWLLAELIGLYPHKNLNNHQLVFAGIAILVYAVFVYEIPKWFGGRITPQRFFAMYGAAKVPYFIAAVVVALYAVGVGPLEQVTEGTGLILMILLFVALIWNAVLTVFGIEIFYKLHIKDAILSYISAVMLGAMLIGFLHGLMVLVG